MAEANITAAYQQRNAKDGMKNLSPHLRSIWAYLTTVANVMDYARIIVYFAAIYGHILGEWWPMSVAIIVNGVIDNFDGTVARALGQCSKLGYIVDCASDLFAVVTNTACIGYAALSSAVLPLWQRYLICGSMHTYGFFFIVWCSFSSVAMGLVTNYKVFHRSPHATLYQNNSFVGYCMYLTMQLWWLALYLYSVDVYTEVVLAILVTTTPLVVVKISIEVENVALMVGAILESDIKKELGER